MIAIIDVTPTFHKNKVEMKNELMWYDAVDKVMHRFSASSLKYEYVEFPGLEVFVKGTGWVQGKTCVSPVVSYKTISDRRDNTQDIVKWISEYGEELRLQVLSMDNREIVVQFPNDREGETVWRDAVEDSLYAKRFRYEITNA